MTQFIATEDFHVIGVTIKTGDIITVITTNKWHCSSHENIFYGNIVQSSGARLIPYFEKPVEERVIDKVKEMYARQPYVKKLTGQTEEVQDKKTKAAFDWNTLDLRPFEHAFIATPIEEESFTFLTR